MIWRFRVRIKHANNLIDHSGIATQHPLSLPLSPLQVSTHACTGAPKCQFSFSTPRGVIVTEKVYWGHVLSVFYYVVFHGSVVYVESFCNKSLLCIIKLEFSGVLIG